MAKAKVDASPSKLIDARINELGDWLHRRWSPFAVGALAGVVVGLASWILPGSAGSGGLLAEQAIKDKRLPLFLKLDAAVQARQPGGEADIALRFLKAQALAGQKQDAAALALLTPLLAASSHPWSPRVQALHKALLGMHGKA